MPIRLAALVVGALVTLVPFSAAAQVELTGTYVRYAAIGSNGTMICSGGSCPTSHSMQYAEATTDPPTCDLYVPGSAVEGFTVETGSVNLTQTGTGSVWTTISGPTVSGRTITWAGRATSGTTRLRIDQTLELGTSERHVRMSVTITNEGTAALTDVYYLRNGDPDHGQCSIGTSFNTDNDVRRQPPVDDTALATATGGDGSTAARSIVVGIGAHDDRARVHTDGFSNTAARAEWLAPVDAGGASVDEAVDIIFRETSLPAAGSTTFEWFYVWGQTIADVESRFDDLGFPTAPCVGLMEGAACTTAGGDTGLCRDTRCCTGCWDGVRCRAGTNSSTCGVGGGACLDCADTDDCTSDVCTAGACTNPDAPAGTSCDDGLFCTLTDSCNGTGTCNGTDTPCDDREGCTTDSCDEVMDVCDYTPLADATTCTNSAGRAGTCHTAVCCTGCWDGMRCQSGVTATNCGVDGGSCGSCVDGDLCSSDVCTVGVCSNPDAPAGTPCNDGMFCTLTDRCDGMRTCMGLGATCNDRSACTIDSCDEATDMCSFVPGMGCVIGGECVAEGSINPSNACQVCDSALDSSDWSPQATGTMCGLSLCMRGRITMQTCNDTGMCVRTGAMGCPTGACLDSNTCEPPCEPGMCPMGTFCSMAGACETMVMPGDDCTEDGACPSGACTDGVCCDMACDGTCERCDALGFVGFCTPVPEGLDPEDECMSNMCDGMGGCIGEPMPDAGPDGGTPDAGDSGTAADSGGADAGDGGVSADTGTPPPPDDGGCGCSALDDRSAPTSWALVLGVAALLSRRRRRR